MKLPPNNLLQSDRARDRRASLADRAFSLQVLPRRPSCIGVPIPSMSCTALSVCPLAKDTRSPIPPLPHANRPVACGDGPGLLSFPQERCIYRPCMPLKKACIQCHSSDDEDRGCVVSWRGGPCRPRVRWPLATGQLMIGSTSTAAARAKQNKIAPGQLGQQAE